MVFALAASLPTAVLLEEVLSAKASFPIAVFESPVTLDESADLPTAVQLDAVVFAPAAFLPTATFEEPVVLLYKL